MRRFIEWLADNLAAMGLGENDFDYEAYEVEK